jgi:hypothetical protein
MEKLLHTVAFKKARGQKTMTIVENINSANFSTQIDSDFCLFCDFCLLVFVHSTPEILS